ASKKLLEMLNKAVAMEMQVSIQYMCQHVRIYVMYSESIGSTLKDIAIEEMKHAEAIAERVDYLGGEPTTKPATITVGNTAEKMLTYDKKAEENTIKFYREIIAQSQSEGDIVSRRLFEDILIDEENHHNILKTLLET
ncbi:MAG: bacterioferritin, partial [Candidatus Thorarchaeota archaeon]